jgi:ubiquinone/menaquinone biosynthesis C-methylase UbiE
VEKLVDLSIIRCPDCGSLVSRELICSGCQRQFISHGNYLDLLPCNLTAVKHGENTVFAADSAELDQFKDRIWRKLIGRLEIERFDREIIPILPNGCFLELAGESCWASAIYKSVYPQSTVFATDVSPNAILNLAIPLARMFPDSPDYFASVDGERLPFNDGVFDCVFIESAMHHFPDPIAMLKEVKRVLKTGGCFVAVDHSVPVHFRFLFRRTAEQRSHTYGIQEDLVSFSRWQKYFKQAGYPINCLKAYTNTKYLRNPLFAIFGKSASFLPVGINQRLFPVGLYVIYIKSEQ